MNKESVHREDLDAALGRIITMAMNTRKAGTLYVSAEYSGVTDEVYIRARPQSQPRAGVKDFMSNVAMSPLGYSMADAHEKLDRALRVIGEMHVVELRKLADKSALDYHVGDWEKITGRKEVK